MGEENKKSQNESRPRRFSQQQYEMLKRCSEKRDMTEWNEWRRNLCNTYEDIWLQGGDFSRWNLKGAILSTDTFPGIHGKVYLQEAKFVDTHLEGSDLSFAYLEGANFNDAHLENSKLYNAHLRGAHFTRACLQKANLSFAELQDARLGFGLHILKVQNLESLALKELIF